MASTSTLALQQELGELQGHCPVLLPCIMPQGYDCEDLWGLAHTEGESTGGSHLQDACEGACMRVCMQACRRACACMRVCMQACRRTHAHTRMRIAPLQCHAHSHATRPSPPRRQGRAGGAAAVPSRRRQAARAAGQRLLLRVQRSGRPLRQQQHAGGGGACPALHRLHQPQLHAQEHPVDGGRGEWWAACCPAGPTGLQRHACYCLAPPLNTCLQSRACTHNTQPVAPHTTPAVRSSRVGIAGRCSSPSASCSSQPSGWAASTLRGGVQGCWGCSSRAVAAPGTLRLPSFC